jgi:hypothetical protein
MQRRLASWTVAAQQEGKKRNENDGQRLCACCEGQKESQINQKMGLNRTKETRWKKGERTKLKKAMKRESDGDVALGGILFGM